jgi:hypothetical protein
MQACVHVAVIPMSASHNLQLVGRIIKTGFGAVLLSLQILLPVYLIAINRHHGGQAQHGETVLCDDPSKLGKTKTRMLDDSARRGPPPDSRGHHAAEASRLGLSLLLNMI